MRGSTLLLTTFSAACALCAAGGARASDETRVLNVPGDYASIQNAVEVAPKDAPVEIRVGPGEYHETVVVSGFSDLRLVGAHGARIVSDVSEAAIAACMSGQVSIEGFEISSRGPGVTFSAVTSGTLLGTAIVSAGGDGVQVSTAGFAMHFHGGHFEGAGRPAPTTVFVSGCRIESVAGSGASAGFGAALTVTGSHIASTRSDGITAIGTVLPGIAIGGITVYDTSFENIGGDGVHVRDAAATVDHVSVFGAVGAGVHLDGTGAKSVTSLKVERVGGEGVYAQTAERVTDCTVIGSGGDGVNVSCADVSGNVVTNSRSRGIVVALTDGATGPGVVANRTNGTAGAGIVLTGDGVAVTDNFVNDAAGEGISATGTEVSVTRNVVTDAATDGICLRVARGAVEGNQVNGCGKDGVDLCTSTRTIVSGNSVTGAGDCGFRLDDGSSHNRLADNTATGSGAFDVWQAPKARANKIAKSNSFPKQRRRRHGR